MNAKLGPNAKAAIACPAMLEIVSHSLGKRSERMNKE
jgi:hypothetical protein